MLQNTTSIPLYLCNHEADALKTPKGIERYVDEGTIVYAGKDNSEQPLPYLWCFKLNDNQYIYPSTNLIKLFQFMQNVGNNCEQ